MRALQFFVGQKLRTVGGIDVEVVGRWRTGGVRVVDDWPKTHILTARMVERVRFAADALPPPFPPDCRRITDRVPWIQKCKDRSVLEAIVKAGDFFQDRVVKAAHEQLAQLPAEPKAETTTKPKTQKKRKAA